VLGHVGDQGEDTDDLAVDPVGNVGPLGVAGAAMGVHEGALEDLLLAGQRLAHERAVPGEHVLADDLADVQSLHLFRRDPEPLGVRLVGDHVAQVGVPVAHQRRKAVEQHLETACLVRRM
jgi:hypothetical protein